MRACRQTREDGLGRGGQDLQGHHWHRDKTDDVLFGGAVLRQRLCRGAGVFL